MRYIFILLIFISCEHRESNIVPIKLTPPTVKESFTNLDSISDVSPKLIYYHIEFITLEHTYSDLEKNQYLTDIDSTEKIITDDLKYKILDEAENNLREVELNDIERIYGKPVKIISRDLFVFDNYMDASISRQNKLNN
jgi:hypothetical protein